MKVYVITSGEYSDYCINAVSLNKETAERICATLNANLEYYGEISRIEEYDTDDIVVILRKMLSYVIRLNSHIRRWNAYIGQNHFIHFLETRLKRDMAVMVLKST